MAHSARTNAGSCRWCQTNCICKDTMQYLKGWQTPTTSETASQSWAERPTLDHTRVSQLPGMCSKIHPSPPVWQSKKSHFTSLHQAMSLTVTQLSLPDSINLWHPPMAPHFKKKKPNLFHPLSKRICILDTLSYKCSFLWTKEEIKDFNNFMDLKNASLSASSTNCPLMEIRALGNISTRACMW